MSDHPSFVKEFPYQNFILVLLCVTCIVGFLSGIITVSQNQDVYVPLAENAAVTPVSFARSLFSLVLSWSVILIFRWLNNGSMFLMLLFFQSFLFGVTSGAIYFTFRSAHWLVSSFLLFSSTANMFLSCCFWCRCICNDSLSTRLGLFLFVFASAFVAALNCWFVSPLWMELFV